MSQDEIAVIDEKLNTMELLVFGGLKKNERMICDEKKILDRKHGCIPCRY